MKARIPKIHTPPLVLFYQPKNAPLPGDAVQALFSGAGFPCRLIGTEHLCQPIGALCGLAGCEERPFEELTAFPQPALVLCGFESETLDSFLQLLRENGLVIPHKAVLTSSNKDWTLAALLDEIEKERQAMEAAREGRSS